MDTITLVTGDTVANLSVTLVRDDTGAAFAPGATGTVRLYIRKKSTTTILATIIHDTESDLNTGLILFAMGPFLSAATAGYYEGEVEITFNSGLANETKQTVFEPISFRLRDDFTV